MKIRKGFVSNSSSSSFIVKLDKVPNSKEDLIELLDKDTFDRVDKKHNIYGDNVTFENAVNLIYAQINKQKDGILFIVNRLLNSEQVPSYDFSELLTLDEIIMSANAYFPLDMAKLSNEKDMFVFLSKQPKEKLINFIETMLNLKYNISRNETLYVFNFGNEYDMNSAWLEYGYAESLFGSALMDVHTNH